jgi:hypothetical protein
VLMCFWRARRGGGVKTGFAAGVGVGCLGIGCESGFWGGCGWKTGGSEEVNGYFQSAIPWSGVGRGISGP